MSCDINVFSEDIDLPFYGITKKSTQLFAKKAADYLKIQDSSFSIILTGNTYIKTINRRFRKKNRPTDVISFAYGEGEEICLPDGKKHLGDIFISIEKALEQSSGSEIREELKRLVVHGILHLLGYDHERNETDAVIMLDKENELLSII